MIETSDVWARKANFLGMSACFNDVGSKQYWYEEVSRNQKKMHRLKLKSLNQILHEKITSFLKLIWLVISSCGSFSSSPGCLPRLWHFRSRCRCCWHTSRLWLWWLWHGCCGGGYAARWIGVRVRRSIGILTTWVIASIISTVPALAWIISCWPAGSLRIITSISSFWGLRKHLRPFTTQQKRR